MTSNNILDFTLAYSIFDLIDRSITMCFFKVYKSQLNFLIADLGSLLTL